LGGLSTHVPKIRLMGEGASKARVMRLLENSSVSWAGPGNNVANDTYSTEACTRDSCHAANGEGAHGTPNVVSAGTTCQQASIWRLRVCAPL
jgi:hypothetical protein